MKLRTAAAALAATASAALTAAAVLASLASPASAASAASLRTDGAATTTNITMTVDGRATPTTIAFDQQPLVELDFDTGNDGSVGITGTFAVLAFDPNGQNEHVVCDNVPMHGFSQGDCTIPDGTLPVGTWKIAAQYNGDSNNDSSVSPAPTLTVTQEPTGTTLSTVASVAYGSESDERFAVAPAPRTSGTPTGQFKVISQDGSTTFCQGPLASGVGKCSLFDTKLVPGTYKFFGEYDGDSTFGGSVSDVETVTVTPGTATTTLTLKPAKIGFGQQQAEQLAVQVAPGAAGTPTGNVAIKAGATTLCSAPVPDSGLITCNLQIGQLPVGSYQLTASYAGDSNFAPSSSAQQLLTITAKTSAKVSLAALKTQTVAFGQEQAEQFTANVTGQVAGVAPTGTVTIKAGSVTLCSFTLAAGPGRCQPTAIKLNPGTYHVTASYGGDVTYAPATSGSQTLTVTAAPTTTSLTLSKTRVKAGQEQQETLTVAVAPKTKSSLTPTGKVTVKAGKTTLCVITLKKARGRCTLTARQLRPGTYHLAAAYPGASPFARSASPAKTLTVTK